jgi:hypothetical protein
MPRKREENRVGSAESYVDKADLLTLLPRLKPLADEWAEEQQARILEAGELLDEKWTEIAKFVGVREPWKVRILVVPAIPKPENPALLAACETLGVLGPGTVGLTLFHGIYLVEALGLDVGLRAHELRHVFQYEQAGSIPRYLDVYLPQLLMNENGMAPFEIDACQASDAVLGRVLFFRNPKSA